MVGIRYQTIAAWVQNRKQALMTLGWHDEIQERL
jgi:hypothetical protein